MNHFLLVFSKTRDSRTVLIDRLIGGVAHLVPYEPGKTQILSLSAQVIFVSTQNHDFLQLGKRHLQDGNHFVAYDGFCWLNDRQVSTVNLFMNAFCQHDTFALNDILNGEFCAAHYHLGSHRLSGVSDFTGLRPLYYMDNPGYFAISNRQMFLNPLLTDSERVNIDPIEVADLLGKGNKFTDRSILKGVRMLRPGFGVSFTPNDGIVIRRSGQPIFKVRGLPTKSDYIRSVQEIVRNFDNLNNIPGLDGQPIRISLTGGEDSRLVLAAALESRVSERIETFTYGFADNPDIAAAGMVAQKAGVPHIKNIQVPSKNLQDRSFADIWLDLTRHAFRFEGAPGAWDGGASRASQTRLDLVGYFDAYFKRVRPTSANIDVISRNVARAFMCEPQQPFDPMGILSAEAIRHSNEFCDSWLEGVLNEGAELNDIPELFYFDFRLPWWGGSMASNVASLYRIAPLASKFAASTGLKQTLPDRRERKFIFEAMLILRRDLLELPYLNKKWPAHFQALAGNVKLPGVELKLPEATTQHSAPPWQITLARRGGGFILDYLNSHPFSELRDVINIPQLTRFLTQPALVNNTPIVRSICNLCEILILAAGDQRRFPDRITDNQLEGETWVTNMPELAERTNGSSPSGKSKFSIERAGEFVRPCEFDLSFPANPVRNVRIDPSIRPSTLTLIKLSLRRYDGSNVPVALNGIRHNEHLKVSTNSEGFLQLVVTGDDPHLYFPVGFSFDAVAGCVLTMKVQPGNGPLEVFFDFGEGFSRKSMISIAY